jgi:uncharacterized protein YdbL (DUF1318 family)
MKTKTHIQKLGRMIAVLAVIATVAAPVAAARQGAQAGDALDRYVANISRQSDALDRYVANISRQPDALDRYLANQGTRPDDRALPSGRVGDALDRYLGNAASTARPDDRAVLPRFETPTTISAGSASQVDWGRIVIGVGAGVAVLLIMGMAFTNRRRLAHT